MRINVYFKIYVGVLKVGTDKFTNCYVNEMNIYSLYAVGGRKQKIKTYIATTF